MAWKLFKDSIRNSITDRYHLMCSIIVHDKKQTSYEYEKRSIVDRTITNNATT